MVKIDLELGKRKAKKKKKKPTKKQAEEKKQKIKSLIITSLIVASLVAVATVTPFYFAYKDLEQQNTMLEADKAFLADRIEANWYAFQGMFSYITPNSYNDSVVLMETQDYLYFSHTMTLTIKNMTGNTFRIPKGENGEYLQEQIEIINLEDIP